MHNVQWWDFVQVLTVNKLKGFVLTSQGLVTQYNILSWIYLKRSGGCITVRHGNKVKKYLSNQHPQSPHNHWRRSIPLNYYCLLVTMFPPFWCTCINLQYRYHQFAMAKGYRSKHQLLNLYTVVNWLYQLSWQICGQIQHYLNHTPICHLICLSVCLSVYLSIYLPICLATYLSIYLSIYLAICLSVCPSVFDFNHFQWS